jgi:hypothetical protein
MNQHFETLVVKELSLVDKGANKEKWLLYKAEDPPTDPPIHNVLLATDLEALASMVKSMQEHMARMMANASGKKDVKYPYPEKKMNEEAELARKKKQEDEEMARKKKDEEEEMARKKKEDEEKEMALLKSQVEELSGFKKIVDELLPSLQQQIEGMNPEAILAEAKKM